MVIAPNLEPWASCYIFSPLSSWEGECQSGFDGYLVSIQGQPTTAIKATAFVITKHAVWLFSFTRTLRSLSIVAG